MAEPPVNPSWRKPATALAILALIALWAAFVLVLQPWIAMLPALVQAPIYLVLGIVWIWVLPLRKLLRWGETGRW